MIRGAGAILLTYPVMTRSFRTWACAVGLAAALFGSGCPTEDCGDGVRDANEECDEGNANSNVPNRCRRYCESPICGDSIVDDAPEYGCEQCDRSPDCGPDCRTTTTSMGTCGDGVMDMGEDCDDGNVNNFDGCESNCTVTATACMM